VGCGLNFNIPNHILHHLIIRGLYNIAYVAYCGLTFIWSQVLMSVDWLEVKENDALIWDALSSLKSSHVMTIDKEDQFLWTKTPTGEYTPKERYEYLNVCEIQRSLVWWWSKVWKLK
jgi:hypothetical protein